MAVEDLCLTGTGDVDARELVCVGVLKKLETEMRITDSIKSANEKDTFFKF